jgi:pyruvate dehydrogenase E1 component alpha subunit
VSIVLERDTALALLRQMVRIRRFEEKCAEAYSAGRIRGFLHLYIGEEAIASGVMPVLGPDDAVVATYREHGHALARGVSADSVMAEMFGKQEGCSRGRGGSMHLFDAGLHFYGGNAIVGGGLPLAAGLALGDKMQQRSRVTACFFGEGAMAEGEFHETMNLAALWKLPVLFLCENNLYAMGTALTRSESDTDLVTKAASYNMAATRVDGMDVQAVYQAAHDAVATIRRLSVPYFLELQTYRFRAHSMFDPELYRPKAEVEKWKQHCPIETWLRRMREAGMLGDRDLAAIEADVAQEIGRAVAFAEAGTWEPVENLERDVCTPAAPPASTALIDTEAERLF